MPKASPAHRGALAISGDDASRLSVYVQVARVLRERIRSGEWIVGQMLPSLSELCDQFSTSRNSMRQALQVLTDDKLIDHARGRQAVVTARPTAAEDIPQLVLAINDPGSAPTSIEVIERRKVGQPPAYLAADGLLYESYTFIRKIHRIGPTPYVVSDFYIATSVFEAFLGEEKRIKIDQLLRQQDKARLEQKRQTISITHADSEVVEALDCTLGETVVTARRWWHGSGGRLLSAARSQYLSKFFIFETVEKIAAGSRRVEIRKPAKQTPRVS